MLTERTFWRRVLLLFVLLLTVPLFPVSAAYFRMDVFPSEETGGTPAGSGLAAEADGVYYFRTGDNRLCRWEGETVRVLSGYFSGTFLQITDGFLYYTDPVQGGFYARDLYTGLTVRIFGFSGLPGYQAGSPVVWWSDGENYRLLSRPAGSGRYLLWKVSPAGELLAASALPEESAWAGYVSGSKVYYATRLDHVVSDIRSWDSETGEIEILLPADPEPNGITGQYSLPLGVWADTLWAFSYWPRPSAPIGFNLKTGEVRRQTDLSGSYHPVAVDGEYAVLYRMSLEEGGRLFRYSFADESLIPLCNVNGIPDDACIAGGVLFCGDATVLSGDPIAGLARPVEASESWSQMAVGLDGSLYRLYTAAGSARH